MKRSVIRAPWSFTLVSVSVVLLAGAALRTVGLGAWSFWGDEVASLNIAASGIADILRNTQELHPPLYYLFLHGWQGLAAGEAWQRLPSALAGVLTLPLVWRIGAAAGDETTGALAAGLLAVSPLHVWYSREARMYVFACLFAVAALYCGVRVLRGGNARHAIGFAAATLLAIYTAYAALLFWVVALVLFPALALRLGTDRAAVHSFWLAQAAVALGFACYLPAFSAQIATGNLGFLGDRLVALTHLGQTGSSPYAWLWLALTGAAVTAGLGAWQLRRVGPGMPSWAPRAIILAFLVFTLLAALPHGFSLKRQLLIFWPAVTLAAAWALRRSGRRRSGRRSLSTAALVVALTSTFALLAAGPVEDWRAAALYVSVAAQPGDAIYAQSDLAGAAFAYYYRGPAAVYAPDASGGWPAPLPLPDPGQTAWLVANKHPALEAQLTPLATRLGVWGSPQQSASFARYLQVNAYLGG